MRIFVCVAEKPSHQCGVRQTPQGCQKGTTQAQAFEEEEEQEVKDLHTKNNLWQCESK